METISFSKVGAEDLNIGEGTFDVRLADSSIATLHRVNLGTFGLSWRLPHMHAGGTGTAANPWVGWESYFNASPVESRIHFVAGHYEARQTLLGKKRQKVTGDGALVTQIRIVGAIKGLDFTFGTIDHAHIYLADFSLIGDSIAAPTTLDLLTIKDFIYATVERLFIEGSADNGIRALHGRNLAIRDTKIGPCGDSHIFLGGVGANDWCNAGILENVTCETVPAGLKPANGALRMEQASYWSIAGLVEELFAGGAGVRLRGSSGVKLSTCFLEWGDDFCVQAYGAAVGDVQIDNCHLHTTLPFKLGFETDGLVHTNLVITHNNFRGISAPSRRFLPGATATYLFWGNSSENPTLGFWVDGYPNFTHNVAKFEGQPVFAEGLAVGTWNQVLSFNAAEQNLELANLLDLSRITLHVGGTDAVVVEETFVMFAGLVNAALGGIATNILPTASLPTGGAPQNGRLIIEDAGGSTRNLIVYAGNLRFRVSGGAAF